MFYDVYGVLIPLKDDSVDSEINIGQKRFLPLKYICRACAVFFIYVSLKWYYGKWDTTNRHKKKPLLVENIVR